jgi:hypothetical protein
VTVFAQKRQSSAFSRNSFADAIFGAPERSVFARAYRNSCAHMDANEKDSSGL